MFDPDRRKRWIKDGTWQKHRSETKCNKFSELNSQQPDETNRDQVISLESGYLIGEDLRSERGWGRHGYGAATEQQEMRDKH